MLTDTQHPYAAHSGSTAGSRPRRRDDHNDHGVDDNQLSERRCPQSDTLRLTTSQLNRLGPGQARPSSEGSGHTGYAVGPARSAGGDIAAWHSKATPKLTKEHTASLTSGVRSKSSSTSARRTVATDGRGDKEDEASRPDTA